MKTGKTLGTGSYATVKEGFRLTTGERFAIKQISKTLMKGKETMMINEIEVLKKVSQGHPNIITLYDYFESPNNLYLVMDLCTGGELFDRLYTQGAFYENDCREIIKTVLNAVQYLHGLNIIHRDIKPENLLYKTKELDSPLMIADFGLSKITFGNNEALYTTCGTPGYMAPEIIQGFDGYGKGVDMWAIGVMTLCGYLPFENPNHVVALDLIFNGKYNFNSEEWEVISPQDSLLVVDPKKRFSVGDALKHAWLNSSVPADGANLMPSIRQGFNARKALKKVVDVVKAVNKLKK